MSEIKMFPYYWTKDVDAAIKFYTEILGFELTNKMPEDGEAVWCELKLNESFIMFSKLPEESDDPYMKRLNQLLTERLDSQGALTMFYKVDDVEALHENAAKKGADIIVPLKDQWWGFREFTILDKDGNLLTFSKQIEK